MCHDLMRDNTYRSLVGVEILLHSVLVVLAYHRFSTPSKNSSCSSSTSVARLILAVHCTRVPGYTTWDYSVDARYCTATA